jgi:tetratricopeptide (TPR) repeat protein
MSAARTPAPGPKRVLLVLASILMALVAAEGLVRAFADVPAVKAIGLSGGDSVFRRSTNPVLSFELKPGYSNPDPDWTKNYERTNSHGQRDRERSLEKPPGTRRVLLLGDSVVEGYGLREEETLSRQLEARMGAAWEVLNFGVSGYCTLAEVELLEVKGLAFDPDAVVLLFVENDFRNFNAETLDLGGTVEQPGWAKALFLRSEVFRLLFLRLDWFGFGAQVDPLRRNQRAIGDDNVSAGLARLRKLADASGFRCVVAIWPRFEKTGVLDANLLPAGTLAVEQLAWEQGIATVRLSESFARHQAQHPDARNPRDRYSQGDTMHPSVEGCRVAAAALEQILAQLVAGSLRPQVPGDLAAARSLARRLSGAGADYAIKHNERGVDALEAGRIDEAIGHFEAALAENPDMAEAHYNLGLIRIQRGQAAVAVAHFERAAQLWPDRADPRSNLGVALARLGEIDAAIRWLEDALRVEPNHADAQRNLRHALELKRGG